MKIYCVKNNIKVKYNQGISFLPVSTIVELDPNKSPTSLELIYETITKTGCRDVLISGDIFNSDGISWLISKLISEAYFVTFYSSVDFIPELPVLKHVININLILLKSIRHNIEFISNHYFTKNNILFLNEDSVDKTIILRNQLQKIEAESKMMFDSKIINKNKLLEKGIFDLFPLGV